MSTRAVYGFKDENGLHWVYVHHDGYPSGAASKFDVFLRSKLHWELPRFEADEAAAGFVAANKYNAGSVRLTLGPKYHGDIEYAYLVDQAKDGRLVLRAFNGGFNNILKAIPFWAGPLDDFIANAEVIEKAERELHG